MPRVCIDFNGVLGNPTPSLTDILERDHGIVIPKASFSKKLVGKVFPNVIAGGRPKRLSRRVYAATQSRLYDSDEFIKIDPMPGAIEAVHALQNAGYDIIIVTDARSVSRARFDAWLSKHKIAPLDTVFTRRGMKPKSRYQCRCDVVIDNDLGQLTPLLNMKDIPRLVHFLPPFGSAGSSSDVSSFDERILSLRGWSEVLEFVLESDTALAA